MRALVVGAGIAGLSVANSLARTGRFTTLEVVDPDPRPVGVAVGLSANALRALSELDVLDGVLAASAPSTTLHMAAADGTTLVHVERETPPGGTHPDNVIVDRASLAAALAAPLGPAGIRSDVGVRDAVPQDSTVTVTFSDGSRDDYDFVVAADGQASRLRPRVWSRTPAGLDQLGLRWLTGPVPGLDHGTMYLGPNATKLGLWPLRGGGTYAFLTIPRPGRPRAAREDVLREMRDALAEYSFAGAGRVADEVPWDQVHIAAFQSMSPEDRWHAGRLVLAGDAAHVMPPHGSSGAAMAIEDAYVLGDEIARAADLDAALEAYSVRRVDRVRRVVDFSTENCIAENEAALQGRPPVMDPRASQEFWEFLREAA